MCPTVSRKVFTKQRIISCLIQAKDTRIILFQATARPVICPKCQAYLMTACFSSFCENGKRRHISMHFFASEIENLKRKSLAALSAPKLYRYRSYTSRLEPIWLQNCSRTRKIYQTAKVILHRPFNPVTDSDYTFRILTAHNWS